MPKDLKSYLKIFRVAEWRAYFLMAFFGFLISRGFTSPPLNIVIFFVVVVSFLAFGFAVNNRFDVKEDKNQTDRVRVGLFFSMLPGIFGLVLSTVFGWRVFLFCLIGLLAAFFYSAPPLRFKERPVWDLLSHGFFAGVFWFILPLLIFKVEWTPFHYFLSFSLFYLSLTLELRNHLEDFELDRGAGLKTSVCVFGKDFSDVFLKILTFLFPLTIFPIFLLDFPKYLLVFLISTLVFVFSFQFLLASKSSRNYKIYRAMDAYANFSFSLLAILTIF